MTPPPRTGPIVVGIDGSRAAIDAALWAADEAVSRGVPIRLVHAISIEDDVDTDLGEDPAEVARDWPETEYGTVALQVAAVVLQETGKPIAVETQILWGEPDLTLIEESQRATMLCVGSTGISAFCRHFLGSTAASLAEQAHSSVAIIRTPHPTPTSEPDWIVTVVDGTPQNQAVVDVALDEAHLRGAPILALGVSCRGHQGIGVEGLDHRVRASRQHRPNVHVHPLAVTTDLTRFLVEHDELSVQLAVLGANDATQTSAILGPHRQAPPRHGRCSVLVVR